jgi:hypothetical protein
MHKQTYAHGHRIPMLMVVEPQDIEFLVKESEVLTGQAGRIFVIAGADWLSYRVLWSQAGFKVERLDDKGQVLHTQHQLPWEFVEHSVIEALQAGQLFTPSVRPRG